MQKYLRSLLVFIILICLIPGQSAQTIYKINPMPVNETAITAANDTSVVDAAHITSPTSLPIHDERKDNSAFLVVHSIIFQVERIPYLFYFVLHTTESAGFMNVRKYQSNYLPSYV